MRVPSFQPDAATYLAVLNMLSVLPVLKRVERLVVHSFEVSPEGYRKAAQLFGGVKHMFLSGGNQVDRVHNVLMMPQLQQICIEVEKTPKDVISTLTRAMLAGRRIILDLLHRSHENVMHALKQQWEDVQATVPAARSVVLRVSPKPGVNIQQ